MELHTQTEEKAKEEKEKSSSRKSSRGSSKMTSGGSSKKKSLITHKTHKKSRSLVDYPSSFELKERAKYGRSTRSN